MKEYIKYFEIERFGGNENTIDRVLFICIRIINFAAKNYK